MKALLILAALTMLLASRAVLACPGNTAEYTPPGASPALADDNGMYMKNVSDPSGYMQPAPAPGSNSAKDAASTS